MSPNKVGALCDRAGLSSCFVVLVRLRLISMAALGQHRQYPRASNKDTANHLYRAW